ncbi:MAG: hypothetical protein QXF82_07645 [Nitrososphaeria archaeon]
MYILAANLAPDGTLYDVKIGDYGFGGRTLDLDNLSYHELKIKNNENYEHILFFDAKRVHSKSP